MGVFCSNSWYMIYHRTILDYTGLEGHIGFILALSTPVTLAGVMGKVLEIESESFGSPNVWLIFGCAGAKNAQFDHETPHFETTTSRNCTPWQVLFQCYSPLFWLFAMHMWFNPLFPILNVSSLYLFLKNNIISTDYTKIIRNRWVNHLRFLAFLRTSLFMNKSIPQSFLFHIPWHISTNDDFVTSFWNVMAPSSTSYIPPFPFRPSSATSLPSRGCWGSCELWNS